MVVGIHVLGTLKGCPREFLEKAEVVKSLLNNVVDEAKLNKVGEAVHQFEPHGATCVILLAESHISVHTWPEHDLMAVDIFTCGKEGNAEKAFDILVKTFKPKEHEKKVVKR